MAATPCYLAPPPVLFRKRKNGGGAAALAESRSEPREAQGLAAEGRGEEAVRLLAGANRAGRDPELELALRERRVGLGIDLVAAAPERAPYAEPAAELPPVGPSRVPEVTREQLSPEVLRASILRYGCLLVRGLADRDDAARMAAEIARAYEVRESLAEGESDDDGYYDELRLDPPRAVLGRPWVAKSGGMFAVDSPRLLAAMFDLFEQAGLSSVIGGYLGERPLVSAEKCTLRQTTPDLPGGWHQDGKFLGDVKAMNLWMSLSHCGDVAPGLEFVPRRFDAVQETEPVWVEDYDGTGEGRMVDLGIQDDTAAELAGPDGISRPIFEPGDALLFDELFLHSTALDPAMTETRYAIESWFFAPSAFPETYVPVAP